jgi:dienelactone hydrolase
MVGWASSEVAVMAFNDFLCIFAGAALWATACAAAEKLDIPADKMLLHATLYRPAGPGPFPAVVALHDCGGLNEVRAATTQLYDEWAKVLSGAGFVVLFPDSFGLRGFGSQCGAR